MTELTLSAGPKARALPFSFDTQSAYKGHSVYSLSEGHAKALTETELPMLVEVMAGNKLIMSAHESIYLLAHLATYCRSLDRCPKGVDKDERKAWRAKASRREEVREAMWNIWEPVRIRHAMLVTAAAVEFEQAVEYIAHMDEPSGVHMVTMIRPRTDRRACGRARRALVRDGAMLPPLRRSPKEEKAIKAFMEGVEA